MQAVGLLKKTVFTTRKERDEDEIIETNIAQVAVEIVLDNLAAEDIAALAEMQNQTVDITMDSTWRARRRPRLRQMSIDALMEETANATDAQTADTEASGDDGDDDPNAALHDTALDVAEDSAAEEVTELQTDSKEAAAETTSAEDVVGGHVESEPLPEPEPEYPEVDDPYAVDQVLETTEDTPEQAVDIITPLSTYIREGDTIIKIEEKRRPEVPAEPVRVMDVLRDSEDGTLRGIRTPAGGTTAEALDENYRLVLSPETVQTLDVLVERNSGMTRRVTSVSDYGIELLGRVTSVPWKEVNECWRMYDRGPVAMPVQSEEVAV